MEYNDNRISLFVAQYGKCYITGEELWFDVIHCHHKKTRANGSTDEYGNLVIVHEDVHRLIHATESHVIEKYLKKLKLDMEQLKRLNKLRKLAGLKPVKQ